MPQLDATSFPSQLFWLMISFVALYVLLARFLLPRVQSVLALRAHTVEGDIEQAERMRQEAARAEEQYEKALADARAKSHAMLVAAQAETARHAAGEQARLDALLEKKLAESDAAIAASRREVMDKLAPVAGDLASLIVEMLVHQKPSAQAVGMALGGIAREGSV